MTIAVKIQNIDSRPDAVIVVQRQNPDGTPVSGGPDVELKGGPNLTGESSDQYVHSGQQLLVREVRQP